MMDINHSPLDVGLASEVGVKLGEVDGHSGSGGQKVDEMERSMRMGDFTERKRGHMTVRDLVLVLPSRRDLYTRSWTGENVWLGLSAIHVVQHTGPVR
jgi:hypothetical protein